MVIIIGLGKTGLSCVDYFLGRGVTPLVMDTRANPPGKEQLPPEVELVHGLDGDLLKQAHMIVASPGIALATPELKAAAEFGVRIVGDIELFVRETQTPVIAITGSNGKSTVTTLVGEMIAEAGLKVGVGGNIGTPALELLKQPMDLCVLELSSFQLETTYSLRAAASVVLNLSEDHMDRYQGVADYRAAKMEIHQHSQHILVNRDDPQTLPDVGQVWQSFGLDCNGYGRCELAGRHWLTLHGEPLLAVDEMKIVGAHNQANALAAMALCDAVGIPREPQLAVLRRFELAFLAALGYGLDWPQAAAGRYRFEPRAGLVLLAEGETARSGEAILSAETLEDVRAGRWSRPETLAEVRALTRRLIDHALDGQELQARRMLRELLE